MNIITRMGLTSTPKCPDAFQYAGDCAPRPFYQWHNGQQIWNFCGLVRVYFSSGPAYDFKTWMKHGQRHWQAVGPA